MEQSALARAGDAGNRRERAQRDVHVHVLQVVQGGAPYPEPLWSGRPADTGDGDPFLASEILSSERSPRRVDRAGMDHLSAMLSRPRSQLEHEIGLLNGGKIVLHHQ